MFSHLLDSSQSSYHLDVVVQKSLLCLCYSFHHRNSDSEQGSHDIRHGAIIPPGQFLDSLFELVGNENINAVFPPDPLHRFAHGFLLAEIICSYRMITEPPVFLLLTVYCLLSTLYSPLSTFLDHVFPHMPDQDLRRFYPQMVFFVQDFNYSLPGLLFSFA